MYYKYIITLVYLYFFSVLQKLYTVDSPWKLDPQNEMLLWTGPGVVQSLLYMNTSDKVAQMMYR